ncbi:MAG: glycosyltransferase family 4 protein [bacterium]|nr:glycosyltransferase family 4 protein [bacterium]
MNVVFLTSKLNFKTAGGSVMDLHLKAKGLADLGHTVTVITAFSHSNILVEPLPYKHIEGMVTSRGLIGIQYGALRILQKYAARADVVYVDGQIFLYGAGLYRLFGGTVPVVAFFNTRPNAWEDIHGSTRPPILKRIKMVLRKFIEHRIGVPIVRNIDAYIFNTPMVEKLYLDWGLRKEKSSVVEDFVDMRGIAEHNHITKEKIKSHQHNQPLITFFSTGRMLKEKGFELIVRAFATLNEKNRYRVVITGAGPDKEHIEALTKNLGLSDFITFPGWVDKETLSRYFLNSHIFIFPKWWLAYGSALLTEALAFGLPCIIPGGGALEWLTEGNAASFKNDDFEDLADKMKQLAEDEKWRVSLAQKGLARVETLDYRVLCKRLEHILETALRKNQPR